jgi:hypothetical protein
MGAPGDIVFLFDVDETLFDTARMKDDLGREVEVRFGDVARRRFWELYEKLRTEKGYADFLGTLEAFRMSHLGDPRALALSNWLMDYPFFERLFPGALAAIAHASRWGLPVILTDGDGVFQPYKLERSGIWQAVEGRVLGYIHKEQALSDVQGAYPARHYVVIDDKPAILAAIKEAWRGHVTTVFVRQGHYARDAQASADPVPADIALDGIADLKACEFSALAPV